jgi:hypothetical protein
MGGVLRAADALLHIAHARTERLRSAMRSLSCLFESNIYILIFLTLPARAWRGQGSREIYVINFIY